MKRVLFVEILDDMVDELIDEYGYGLFINGWMHARSIDEALEMTRTWL